MATNHGVLVFSETADQKITTVTRQLFNIGRKLSDDLGQPLGALIVGKDTQEAAKEAVALGADKVYVVDGPATAEAHPDFCTAIIAEVSRQEAPSLVLLGHTDMGRDVAPRLAARLGGAVVMDCTGLAIDASTKQLLQTKPVYGGKAMAVWSSEHKGPQIVTLRRGSVIPAEPDASRKGEVISLSVTVGAAMVRSKLVETVREEVKGVKLDEAKVIVSGGGGIGGAEGFQMVRDLAQALGGAVGITTVPSDEGWMPSSAVVGQSGHIVSPDLYIAIGISGAPQHTAGCLASKCIVTINKDADAPMFRVSNFGVVGDCRKVLPPLIERCRTLVK